MLHIVIQTINNTVMDYEVLHDVVFGKGNSIKTVLFSWFECDGSVAYEKYLKICKTKKEQVKGKYKTPVSQLKKLIAFLAQIEKNNNDEVSKLNTFQMSQTEDYIKWKNNLNLTLDEGLKVIKDILIKEEVKS